MATIAAPSREELWHMIVSTAVHARGWALLDAKIGGVNLPEWPLPDEPAPAGIGVGDAVALRPPTGEETLDTVYLLPSGGDSLIGMARHPKTSLGWVESWDSGASAPVGTAGATTSALYTPIAGEFGACVSISEHGIFYARIRGALDVDCVYAGYALPGSVYERARGTLYPIVGELGPLTPTLICMTEDAAFVGVDVDSMSGRVLSREHEGPASLVLQPTWLYLGAPPSWVAEIPGLYSFSADDLRISFGRLLDSWDQEYVYLHSTAVGTRSFVVDTEERSLRVVHYAGYAGGPLS